MKTWDLNFPIIISREKSLPQGAHFCVKFGTFAVQYFHEFVRDSYQTRHDKMIHKMCLMFIKECLTRLKMFLKGLTTVKDATFLT